MNDWVRWGWKARLQHRPWLTPCGFYLHQSCIHIHLIWNCHLSIARRSSPGIAGIIQITVMTAVFRQSSEWRAGICFSSAFKMKVSPRNILAILNDETGTAGKVGCCRTSCGLEAYSSRLDNKTSISRLICQVYMCGLCYNWWPCCAPLQVHRKIREDSDMAQDSLQCLAQLASLHGPIFPDERSQVDYLAHFIEGLLNTINGYVQIIVVGYFTWIENACIFV